MCFLFPSFPFSVHVFWNSVGENIRQYTTSVGPLGWSSTELLKEDPLWEMFPLWNFCHDFFECASNGKDFSPQAVAQGRVKLSIAWRLAQVGTLGQVLQQPETTNPPSVWCWGFRGCRVQHPRCTSSTGCSRLWCDSGRSGLSSTDAWASERSGKGWNWKGYNFSHSISTDLVFKHNIIQYNPYHPCMVYLNTFAIFYHWKKDQM